MSLRSRVRAACRLRAGRASTSVAGSATPGHAAKGKPSLVRSIEDIDFHSTIEKTFLERLVDRIEGPKQPGTLILVRHGESQWNQKKLFTGWCDVDLSDRGVREIEHSARLLLERGHTVDICYTSVLKRAIRSSWILLRELHQVYRPMVKSYLLNERMYGALEGLSKADLATELGEETVQAWRAGLLERPPPVSQTHLHYHQMERKYSRLDPSVIPSSESLQDTIDRVSPLWEAQILPDLKAGRNVLIVAHGNSLRGIVKTIDNLSTLDIQRVGIPNGIPLVYKFDANMKPIAQRKAVHPLSGEYLEKKGLLRAALEREDAHYASCVDGASKQPGGGGTASIPDHHESLESGRNYFLEGGVQDTQYYQPSNAVIIQSLTVLEQKRKLFEEVDPRVGPASKRRDGPFSLAALDGAGRNPGPVGLVDIGDGLGSSTSFDDNSKMAAAAAAAEAIHARTEKSAAAAATSSPATPPIPSVGSVGAPASPASPVAPSTPKLAPPRPGSPTLGTWFPVTTKAGHTVRPLLVIIRHGKTEHNKLGLFTGWEDAQLAPEGRTEAAKAGRLLQKYGIEFDVVYTSWLSRAIETAWLVLNELDSLWLPIVKTWRLNERMYGALTGLSKKMIRQQHGQEQFMRWRRGFDTVPPPASSFSPAYPGNDDRYIKYCTDIKISPFETFVRSLAHGKLEVHRQFPKSESLKNCMERTIPYFKEVIVPVSLNEGKSVLIASSENAIRGLLMHLCDIPIDRIHEVEIPTGLPMIYDHESRRIRLLEDEEVPDPMSKYEFGSSPELFIKMDDDEDPV